MMVDVVRNPQKSKVYACEIERVRCVGVYSGMMYGCVEVCFSSFGIFFPFCFSTAAAATAAAAVGGAASFCIYTKTYISSEASF